MQEEFVWQRALQGQVMREGHCLGKGAGGRVSDRQERGIKKREKMFLYVLRRQERSGRRGGRPKARFE